MAMAQQQQQQQQQLDSTPPGFTSGSGSGSGSSRDSGRVVLICAETGRRIANADAETGSVKGRTEPRVSIRHGAYQSQGGRSYQEDALVAVAGRDAFATATTSGSSAELGDDKARAFFGVFDGHGGTDCAHYLRDTLMDAVAQSSQFPHDVSAALEEAFHRTDRSFGAKFAAGELDASGATAVCVTFWGDERYFIANTGDCRAVLSRRGRSIELTTDHKPDAPKERERIKACGGFIEDGYINGMLGCSRAFGDYHFESLKPWHDVDIDVDSQERQPLSSTPESEEAAPAPAPEVAAARNPSSGPLTCAPDVFVQDIDIEEDEFIVLACDGLWDVFSSNNCIEYTRQRLRVHNDAALAARELVDEAVVRRNATDNVTAIVVCFGDEPPPQRQYVRMSEGDHTDATSSEDGEGSEERGGGGGGGGLPRSGSGRIRYSLSQGALAALANALDKC